MSFDLGVWCAESPITAEEATRKYISQRDGASEAAQPCPEVTAFYEALTRHLPDLTADNYESSPWSTPLTVGDEFVMMSVVFPRAGEVCRAVLDLAERHGLVCFDPQAECADDDADVMEGIHFSMSDGSIVIRSSLEDLLRSHLLADQ